MIKSLKGAVRAAKSLVAVLLLATLTSQPVSGLDRTWIGGNIEWVDGGVATNWNPNGEPGPSDRAIFNTANVVNLGSNNIVDGLALSGAIDLFTNEFDLTVDGLVEVAGAGSFLFIEEAAGSVDADDVTINADGTIELVGGTLTMNEEVGTSLIDINANGNLFGHGTISFADVPGALTTVLVNDGELTALSRGPTIFSPPPVGALQINTASGTFTRVDLDGAGEAGVVNVNRNQTLDLNVGFADSFNGTMNLFQESHFNSLNAWTLAGGSIQVNNGFIDSPFPTPDVPAGTAFIEGGLLTQTGGTINVADTDGTLQMDVNFTMNGGSITNFGTVIFNGVTNINTASGYAPSDINSQTIVNADVTINDAAGDFNWDGAGAADTTVNGSATLSITADQIDTGNDTFGGTITLNNGGDLTVNNTANLWTMGGTLEKTGPSFSTISGDAVTITGVVNVGGTGSLNMPATTLSSTANVNVTSQLFLGSSSVFAGPATLTGTGELEMEGTSSVSANTTVSVATFDWDGVGTGTNHTINAGVVFTIESSTLDTDGDMDDPINLAGNGSQLIVNNTNGLTQWTATAAINANNAGVGTATISGTSRLILSGAAADLNVNGNTTISAPLTFGASSVASIDAGFTLDANNQNVAYSGGTITGAGTFSPGANNTVTADSSITANIFDFDGGSWTIESGAELTVNVTDYDTTATNAFDTTITLNGGDVTITTGDAEFIMDGTLNMHSDSSEFAEWLGEPLDIGNDAGTLDADVNVSGTFFSRISAPVDFNSDTDVNVDGVALLLTSTVNFNTVNGVNNAEFTGDGIIRFGGAVNVNEAVTLNMVGGSVDLDGSDAIGDFVNIDAPLVINAAAMSSFGQANAGGGVNTLDVNNSVGTGVLTVNLDNAADEWTLNGPGTMNLVNDNAEATLLAGSDVNINGTVNVTGDVRTTARLDITGDVNINTAGQPLRLAGGDNVNDPNTIAGGTISGVGILGADNGKELRGFGTINTSVDFVNASNLFADNGTLTINGAILEVARIGTFDVDGVLNVVNPWDTGVASFVTLEGGTIQGGTMTINNGNGVSGEGLITSRLVNNVRLRSSDGTLVAETAGNDNDWDGAAGGGVLAAINVGTLELRDVGAAFPFTGTVEASTNSRVFTNGFALDFNPGSTLNLASSTYESTNSTDIGGTVTVNVGAPSTIQVENNSFLSFETGSTTTLNGDLRLLNNNIIVEAGAAFSGAGALVVPDGSHLVAENLAEVDVLLNMQGAFRPGNSQGIGRVDLGGFQMSPTSELYIELIGTALNAFDRLVVDDSVVVDGFLSLDIDDVSPGVPFVPVLGNTFPIITGTAVTGTFDTVDVSGMPAGLAFRVNYLANAVQLEVVNKPIFDADFDEDGDVDSTDLSIWQNAYDLNQLGDADGDNDSDGRDFLIWQRQFGSAPLSAVSASVAVPEPTGIAALCLAALNCLVARGRRCG